MKTQTYAKKALAVVLSVAMLLSCMVFTGINASAVESVKFIYDFSNSFKSSYVGSYYGANGSDGNNSKWMSFSSSDVYNGHDNAMVMEYRADNNGVNGALQGAYSIMSFPNNSGASYNGRGTNQTVYLKQNQKYKLTIVYKCVSHVVDSQFSIGLGLGALANYQANNGGKFVLNLATVTGTHNDWQVATATFTPSSSTGLYLAYKPVDIENATVRAGEKVLVGEFRAEPLATITLNNDGNTSTVDAVVGDALTLPTPTRENYEFKGWFQDNTFETPVPATAPAANPTYYAKWEALAQETTVTFMVDGKNVGSKSGVVGTSVSTAGLNIAENYKVLNWYMDEGLTQVADFIFASTDTTYYASFEKDIMPGFVFGHDFNHNNRSSATGSVGNYPAGGSGDNNRAVVNEAGGYMQLGGNGNDKYVGAFRVFAENPESYNSKYMADTNKPGSGTYFAIVKYKTVSAPKNLEMWTGIFGQNWNNGVASMDGHESGNGVSAKYVIPAGTVDTEWQTATFKFDYSGGANGFHVMVRATEPCTNGQVLVDSVRVYKVLNNEIVNVTVNDNINNPRTQPWVKNTEFALPGTTVRDGFEYGGWFTTADFQEGTEVTSPVTVPETDIAYYCKWIAEAGAVDDTFVFNGETLYTRSGKAGTTYLVPVAPAADKLGKYYAWRDANGNAPTGTFGEEGVEYTATLETYVEDFESYGVTGNDASTTQLKGNGSAKHIVEGGHDSAKAWSIKLNEPGNSMSFAKIAPKVAGNYVTVKENTNYRISVWVKAPEAGSFYLTVGTTSNLDGMWVPNISLDVTKAFTVEADTWMQLVWEDISFTNNIGKTLTFGAGYGSAKNSFASLDDLTIEEYTAYIPDESIGDFEKAIIGTDVMVGGSSQYANAYISNKASHTPGDEAVKSVVAYGTDGSGNARPQFVLKDFNNEDIAVEAGKHYSVSFWVMEPSTYNYYQGTRSEGPFRYWLAIADNETVFSPSYKKDDHKVAETVFAKLTADVWTQVKVNFMAPANGYLRLGVSENASSNHFEYYIDDVVVKEEVSADLEKNVVSFEDIELGTNLDVRGNTSDANKDQTHTIKVTNEVAHSGDKALVINNSGIGSGNIRATLEMKYADGNFVTLQANHDYLVTFWAKAGTVSGFEFWVAAEKEEGKGFYVSADKDSHGLYKTGESSYKDYCQYLSGARAGKKDEWELVAVRVTAKNNANDVEGKRMVFGFSNEYQKYGTTYVDDFQVIDLTTGQGGMATVDSAALYIPGVSQASRMPEVNAAANSAVYTAYNVNNELTEYAAIRLFGSYTTSAENNATIRLNGSEYEIVERGMEVYADGVKLGEVSVKKADMANYWEKDGNEVYYSILVNNINKTDAAKVLTAKTWVKAIIDGKEVLLTSNLNSGVSANDIYDAACEASGVTYGWFAE